MALRPACAILAAAAFLHAVPALAEDPIKIGALVSLSGSFASPSKDMLEGMQLVLDQRQQTLGGRPVSLLVRDDQGKPEMAVEEANRLVRSEHVDFITGAGLSSVLLAVYRPILASETFLIGSNSGLDALAGKNCSPFFFSASFQNGQSSTLMGRFLTEQKIDSVFILAPNYQGGKDAMAGFKRGYKGNIVGEVYTPMQQTDFSAEISRVRAAKPSAVFVFYPGTWGVQWIKQYSEAELTGSIPLYSIYMLDEANIAATGKAAVGMYSISHWVNDIDNPANKDFVKTYTAKFGHAPSAFSAQGFDSMQLIASGIDGVKGDLSDKAKTRAALTKADFHSVRGPFSFNSNHFPIENFYLTKVEDTPNGPATVTVKTVAEQAKDEMASECPMK
jgi:branched-chain amino acid transport system substrate-binding protein